MSQLDLSLAAEISARHLSFLETGRAQPSEAMVLRLGATLNIPLRQQNEMLEASGFKHRFEEPSFANGLEASIEFALNHMLAAHEPFPMVMLNQCYDIVRMNRAMERLLDYVIKDQSAMGKAANICRILFDPRLARDAICDWEKIGSLLLSRLHRESLQKAENTALRALVDELLHYPGIPAEWRQPNFEILSSAAYSFRFRTDDIDVAFLTTMTVFDAPTNITLEELRIESYFPLDESTQETCRRLAKVNF